MKREEFQLIFAMHFNPWAVQNILGGVGESREGSGHEKMTNLREARYAKWVAPVGVFMLGPSCARKMSGPDSGRISVTEEVQGQCFGSKPSDLKF